MTQTSSHNWQPTMVLHLSADDFLQLGLQLAGFDQQCNLCTCAATNLCWFKSNFEVSPKTCAEVFKDFQTTHIDAARLNKPNPAYLMMAMHWLATYKTKEQIADTFKVVEKTEGQRWIWLWKMNSCWFLPGEILLFQAIHSPFVYQSLAH
jgi:hypothetical protein